MIPDFISCFIVVVPIQCASLNMTDTKITIAVLKHVLKDNENNFYHYYNNKIVDELFHIHI